MSGDGPVIFHRLLKASSLAATTREIGMREVCFAQTNWRETVSLLIRTGLRKMRSVRISRFI
jgi:hypothetical protein